MIKPVTGGFQVFDDRTGQKVGGVCRAFDDAVNLHSEVNPAPETEDTPAGVDEDWARKGVSPWGRGSDFVCTACSIKPEEATPERIARENAAARYHGTGAHYSPDGKCHMPTRRSRAREHGRRSYADFDAGFGDRAPS